jgi:SAM-dependent methyltransferase
MVADAQAGIPLQSEFFDLVTALDLFEHLGEPGAVLQEIRRVLCTHGVAYLKICHPRHPNASRDPSHINVQPLLYWRRTFRQAGFRWQRLYETDCTVSQGLWQRLKACFRRWREWAVIGTPADYKFLLWKRVRD